MYPCSNIFFFKIKFRFFMKINTLRIKIHVFVTILFFHIFLMIGSITTTHHKTTIYTSKCNISWYHFNICSFFFYFFISIYAIMQNATFQLNFMWSKMYHLETSCLRNCYKSNQIVVSDLDRKKKS